MQCSILYVADFSLGHALLQLFLHSTPSVPLLRKPFLIKPRYEIDIVKRNGNQKHLRTFHFSRAQEKPFRAPKVPRGTKKPIPVALKPIPGTKKQILGHQKHRPEQKNTTGTKKTKPGKMTPREGKTPFREQKTRNPFLQLICSETGPTLKPLELLSSEISRRWNVECSRRWTASQQVSAQMDRLMWDSAGTGGWCLLDTISARTSRRLRMRNCLGLIHPGDQLRTVELLIDILFLGKTSIVRYLHVFFGMYSAKVGLQLQ